MISLKEHRTALVNLKTTIMALDDLDYLIEFYSVDKPGPAYVEFDHIDGPGKIRAQIDRSLMIMTLKAQRQKLVDYLATMGIEV